MYNSNEQVKLINSLLSDITLFTNVNQYLNSSYFSDYVKKPYVEMMNYYKTHSVLPSASYMNAKNEGFEFDDSLKFNDTDRKDFITEFENFINYSRFNQYTDDIIDAYEKKDFTNAENITKKLSDAVKINDKTPAVDLFGSLSDIYDAIREQSIEISTGFDSLDDLVGPMNPGQLIIYAANSGIGKSIFLQNHTVNAYLNDMNVLYITIEMSKRDCFERILPMLASEHISDLKNLQRSEFEDIFKKINQNRSNSLYIAEIGEGSLTSEVDRIVQEIELRDRKKIDIVCVDYIDILMPVARVNIENLSLRDKAICEELRSIAKFKNIPLITATQLNRSAIQAEELDHSHISGGITKINTADLVLGVSRSAEDRENGLYNIKILKSRKSSSTEEHLKLKFCKKSLRLSDLKDISNDSTQANSMYEQAKSDLHNAELSNSKCSNDDFDAFFGGVK